MITVVGSVNMDLVVRTKRFPEQGETAMGELFATVPGGKGANQAVAAARLGGDVQMIGAVGTDAFGDQLLRGLEAEEVNVTAVKRKKGASGIANILLSEGDNRIIVVPGANYRVTPEEVSGYQTIFSSSHMVMMQLEMPAPVIQRTLEICRSLGVPTILNPAPADGFRKEFLSLADYLTPNETEAEALFGKMWTKALEDFPNRLVVTLGKEGARFYDGENHIHVKGFHTQATDTTGAGDAFNGALCVALSEGIPFKESVYFANAAASLAVEKFGAQGGMPDRKKVLERLKGHS
ncbi:ribokinase [Planomicrobium sp. CPCC 101110]|uniref:ribokinase n=1 Tax=Planomicrobium sp. CPCC 101110 TaxID=2599619 RepID=UPI0011B8121B|nr:ribokinase [Planomicrobium sp. CPCC 101110]TWT27485.1 ribokinase [Planomicrobium sp. CPCC 101110]